MATLGTDPRYRSLATSAAAIVGSSSSSIVAAILAQWQCEQPGGPSWPPVHNNPGFVTVGALRSVGIPAAAATISPGVGFLARFASPSEGASAYAQLLARGARYKDARAAIAAGDGAKFLEKVTAAGYGTRYSCAISAYRAITGAGGTVSVPGATTPATPTGPRLPAWGGIVSFPVGKTITAADVDVMMAALDRAGFFRGYSLEALPGEGAAQELTRGVLATAIGKPWNKELQDDLQRRFGAAAAQAGFKPLGGVFDSIATAIGDAAFTFVVLGSIAALLLLGVWRLMR